MQVDFNRFSVMQILWVTGFVKGNKMEINGYTNTLGSYSKTCR